MADEQTFEKELRRRRPCTPPADQVPVRGDEPTDRVQTAMMPIQKIHVPKQYKLRQDPSNREHACYEYEYGCDTACNCNDASRCGNCDEKYVIVMPLAETTLWETLGTHNIAGVHPLKIVQIFRSILETVKKLLILFMITGELDVWSTQSGGQYRAGRSSNAAQSGTQRNHCWSESLTGARRVRQIL